MVLNTEAEAWSIRKTPNLELINSKINELFSYAVTTAVECFGINKQKALKTDSYYKKNLGPRNTRHLYKLSHYKNEVYEDVWVSYMSGTNPADKPEESRLFEGFIISEVGGELKIIGAIIVSMDEMTMDRTGWEESVYNPDDLDINNLGQFVETQRYAEPRDDGFSMEEYLADK